MPILVVHSLSYLYSSLERLFDPEYQPTEQDIIRCRTRANGIAETTFYLRKHEMIMVDVRQRSERRKWIHCFQDVTSLLFLVDLSSYDQCLAEDKDAVSRSLFLKFGSYRRVITLMPTLSPVYRTRCRTQWRTGIQYAIHSGSSRRPSCVELCTFQFCDAITSISVRSCS